MHFLKVQLKVAGICDYTRACSKTITLTFLNVSEVHRVEAINQAAGQVTAIYLGGFSVRGVTLIKAIAGLVCELLQEMEQFTYVLS